MDERIQTLSDELHALHTLIGTVHERIDAARTLAYALLTDDALMADPGQAALLQQVIAGLTDLPVGGGQWTRAAFERREQQAPALVLRAWGEG